MTKKREPWRPATYPAAKRLGRLLLALAASPLGISLEQASHGVSDRTWLRYRGALQEICGDELVESDDGLGLRSGWQDRLRLEGGR